MNRTDCSHPESWYRHGYVQTPFRYAWSHIHGYGQYPPHKHLCPLYVCCPEYTVQQSVQPGSSCCCQWPDQSAYLLPAALWPPAHSSPQQQWYHLGSSSLPDASSVWTYDPPYLLLYRYWSRKRMPPVKIPSLHILQPQSFPAWHLFHIDLPYIPACRMPLFSSYSSSICCILLQFIKYSPIDFCPFRM